MFGRLLTPLVAHFDLSPRPDAAPERPADHDHETEEAESFARDVLIEIMRNSVESLKEADGLPAKLEVMGEIHRVMVEDACTKDVFRELDGFLLIVNVLAILHDFLDESDSSVTQTEEGERLVFMLLAESLKGHIANQLYFQKHVGYDTLRQALLALVRDRRTTDQVFGFLLSVSQENFALSSIFNLLREMQQTDFSQHKAMLGTVVHPHFLMLLINLIEAVEKDDEFLHIAVYNLVEILASLSHRNQALLSSIPIFSPAYSSFLNEEGSRKATSLKLCKKLASCNIPVTNARILFKNAIKDDGVSLDTEVLEIIRAGMKGKWPQHYTLENGAAFEHKEETTRGLPLTGFTFMLWLRIEHFPNTSHTLFRVNSPSRVLIHLLLRPDGILEFSSAGNERSVLLNAKVEKNKWVHIALVHYPHRATNPSIRFFVDGVLRESRQWMYPRPDSYSVQPITYLVGESDPQTNSGISWSIASAYCISLPLGDDTFRFIQHLGFRYTAHFQAKDLVRFFTYEAVTSLNIQLSAPNSGARQPLSSSSPLARLIKNGLGISEDAFLFSVIPAGSLSDEEEEESGSPAEESYIRNGVSSLASTRRDKIRRLGNIFAVTQDSLDLSLMKVGGAAVALRLVQAASTSHELSRTLAIFTESARQCWQMSEDMERTRAYEILGHILKSKAPLINVTAFEILFEFLGLNSKTPDRSVVINTIAYRAIALDFELWAHARDEIQQMYFGHFSTMLRSSKYKSFNAKSRFTKFGAVRKLLFVLQTTWYPEDMIPHLIEAFKCIAASSFSAEDAIKPIVSYLAAKLHDVPEQSKVTSPRSIVSQLDRSKSLNKPEHVLVALTSILQTGNNFARFSAALPVPRVILLLLGEQSSNTTAAAVLKIVNLALQSSASFSRRFEMVSGWNVLKMVLPPAWDSDVQKNAFEILFGISPRDDQTNKERVLTVRCSHILPVILSALDYGLNAVIQDSFEEDSVAAEAYTESLLEELIDMQSTSPTFRQAFKSQQTTGVLISAYSSFVTNGHLVRLSQRNHVRILEKLNHFVLALSLDNNVGSSQKQEMLDNFKKAEELLNMDYPTEDAQSPRPRIQTPIKQGPSASIQLLGERALQKTMTKIRDWRKTIIASERKRLRRSIIDLHEFRCRVEQSNSWRSSLFNDRGLWARKNSLRQWMLDETEGPCRVRKKLMHDLESMALTDEGNGQARAITEQEGDAQSFVQVEMIVPPWAEGNELQTEGEHSLDEFADDKLRRVRHELHPGDVIEGVCTVTRIVGVDSSPGLLILGRSHLYMLDGLVQDTNGEVIDARDAPRNLFSVPGSVLELDGNHRALKWPYEQVSSFSKKMCLFRDVALELYFKDSRSLLLVFSNKRLRQEMSDKLTNSLMVQNMSASRSPLLHRTPLLGKMSARLLSGMRDELSTAQRKWQAREISNFTYISVLNQTSGRTPGDATQYPIFPWVLSDYTSSKLDLTSPSSYRDLSRPMGALTEARRGAARQRYEALESIGETPFHYGTHFSSSMIVCHYLIRLEPYTHMFKTLQGGDWDLPDRLFSDIARAYHSASQDVRGDVRELIPEFFTCPEFLQNSANLDFGVQQNTGERIHDVKLPPWAKNDPLLFITEHRKALESDYVSENLPAWIDLIWGYKQRDAESFNVFHPLSYEGSIDLDKISDELEREATVGIIHNFGQTPRKLFDAPHPARFTQGPTTLPLGSQYGFIEDVHELLQSSEPHATISQSVEAIVVDMISERVVPCPSHVLHVPQFTHEQICWGFPDQSLKLVVDRKVTQVIDSISCTCATFADADLLITGSTDSLVRLWRLSRREGHTTLSPTHTLRAHSARVLCVAACRMWSIAVSGSEDGTAVIWDLNRALYVRTIDHRDEGEGEADEGSVARTQVRLVAINESTGNIAACSTTKLTLHTINASLIVSLDLTHSNPNPYPHPSSSPFSYPSSSSSGGGGYITSLAFHEREYSRLGLLATGTSAGTIHLRTWSAAANITTPMSSLSDAENTNNVKEDTGENATKAKWEFVTLRTLRCREQLVESEPGSGAGPASGRRIPQVRSLQFVGETLYHGDDEGQVFAWELPA